MPPAGMKRYKPSDEVDVVIVGAGSSGGILARELSRARLSVVVLEQGPWLTERDFNYDELSGGLVDRKLSLTNVFETQPGTRRSSETEATKPDGWFEYGRCVGGGSIHFTANFWRFPEVEFMQATRHGVPENSSVADWPIRYADLEPYYTKVEWGIGVSGLAGNPFEPPRSKPYPLPPLPIKSEGVLLERAAKKMGLTAWPAPMAILSRPYKGRSACAECGYCIGYGCQMRAKSSTMTTVIPEAVATGRCEIRTDSYVRKIELNAQGRVSGVVYFDKNKREHLQRAKVVVLSANGVETAKLLLMSRTSGHDTGLANSSDQVGRNIMFNGGAGASAMFDHDINSWKGHVVSRVIWDWFEPPASLAVHGGGGYDFRNSMTPVAARGSWTGEPTWGKAWKEGLHDRFCRTLDAVAHTSDTPVAANRMDLDETTKDAWGLPVPRLTWRQHPNDLKLAEWFRDRGVELLQAAGAKKIADAFANPGNGGSGEHLLGTCRMGNDPRTSVVDANHRTHDVRNLFICDGSSFVTSGRGQPTLTIMALAFRAAERLSGLIARRDV